MKQPTIQVRRKPQQSRAKMTQDALIDTFVRLLNEKTANAITIREMTDIAGIGLGTFYEYFSKKDDLIALMIHQHVKNNAETLKTYAQSQTQLSTKLSFQDYLAQVIHFQILQVEAQQHLWAQTFLLERQISSIEIYQKSYVMMVQMWRSILVPYIDNETALQHLSLNVQRVCYGFISQTLLIEPEFAEWEVLEEDILLALKGLHL